MVVCKSVCADMESLVKKRDFYAIVRALENGGGRKFLACQKFPDIIILLLEGYTQKKVSEEKTLSILRHLKRIGVLTTEQKERIKCLEFYSYLKNNLSKKIISELS